jgi:alpha-tubulin suppressor-like RCC1 family protein
VGDGTTDDKSTPTPVKGLTDVRLLAAGFSHSCALDKKGDLRCWGSNTQGELGDGTIEDKTTPTPVRW